MPIERTISIGSTSSSAPKRHLPFKPPGPAKKAKPSTTTTSNPTAKPNGTNKTTPAGPSRPQAKSAATVISSSSETEESEDYGGDITFDLESPEQAVTTESRPRTTTTTSRPSKRPSIADLSDSESDLPSDPEGLPARNKTATKPRPSAAAVTTTLSDNDDDDDGDQLDTLSHASSSSFNSQITGIPPALLTRLIHEHFTDKSLRISKSASGVLCKYIDVFVREAVARAAAEKAAEKAAEVREQIQRGGGADAGGDRTRGIEDEWLDVADLEKVAGGLVMDF